MRQQKLARIHQEARDRALRDVRARVQRLLVHLEERNYGLAEAMAVQIVASLDDDNRLPDAVEGHLIYLAEQAGINT
jgi:hypothetical protein